MLSKTFCPLSGRRDDPTRQQRQSDHARGGPRPGWMRTTITRGLEDSPDVTALINGMTLGLRHEAPNDIEDPFQQTGTLHLFAVAGLHVGIIAQLLWILACSCAFRAWPRRRLSFLVSFFSRDHRSSCPSLRAAIMAAFLVGGIFFDRPVLALNSLAGAALLILASTQTSFLLPGFNFLSPWSGRFLSGRTAFFASCCDRPKPIRFSPQPDQPIAAILRTQLPPGRGRGFGFRRGLGRFSASHRLVFLPRHTDLAHRESHGGTDRILRFGAGLMSLLAAIFSPALSLVFNNANWSLAQMILRLVQVFAQLPGGHAYVERPHWPTQARAELPCLMPARAPQCICAQEGRIGFSTPGVLVITGTSCAIICIHAALIDSMVSF